MINTMDKELYSTIETLIIKWGLDGFKTAGHLTRQAICKSLNIQHTEIYKIVKSIDIEDQF